MKIFRNILSFFGLMLESDAELGSKVMANMIKNLDHKLRESQARVKAQKEKINELIKEYC